MLETLHANGFTDINSAHFQVLRWPGPNGQGPVELAEQAGMTRQAMNYLLGQVENRGYLERRIDPDDVRSRRVYLTEREPPRTPLLEMRWRNSSETGSPGRARRTGTSGNDSWSSSTRQLTTEPTPRSTPRIRTYPAPTQTASLALSIAVLSARQARLCGRWHFVPRRRARHRTGDGNSRARSLRRLGGWRSPPQRRGFAGTCMCKWHPCPTEHESCLRRPPGLCSVGPDGLALRGIRVSRKR
jgi:hypothetical protein